MTISVFSVIMSILCASVILFVAGLLISHTQRVRWGLLLLIIILGFVRLSFPFEFLGAKEIHSRWLYPLLSRIAKLEIIRGLTCADIFGIAWMTGIGVLLMRFLTRLICVSVAIRKATPVRPEDALRKILEQAADELHMKRRVRLAVTDSFSTAVSVGFFHPIILIPRKMLTYSEAELSGVIRHEMTHYLRGDVGKQWILCMVQCLFWWNFVVHYLKHCVEDMLELECDEKVCQGLDDEGRLAYLNAIKRVLREDKKKQIKLGMGYGSNQAGKFLQRRFVAVLEPVPKHSGRMTYLLAALSIILFCLSYSFVLQPVVLPTNMVADDVEIRTTTAKELGNDSFLLKLPDGSYVFVSDMLEQGVLTEQEIQKPPYNGLSSYEKISGEEK